MELRHLRYFVAVAEELHFGRAAERLHMAQPPLSHQIRQFEEELGVTLLHRSTRKVELTVAGAVYLERARSILQAVDAANRDATRAAAGEIGELSIGFTGSATYELLPGVTRILRAELPRVSLTVKGEMLTPAQVDGLRDGTLDIGLLRPPVHDPELTVHIVRTEPLIAALPEAHPLARNDAVRLADLRDEPFITYPSHFRSVVHDAVLDACREVGFRPRDVTEVSETSTLVTFIAAGLGVAVVPASVRRLEIPGAVYRPLAATTREVELALAFRAGDPDPLLQRVIARLHRFLGGPRPQRTRGDRH
ncbi:LysR substrate-binding domain-containing protein [Tomitella fengzijianii]|uniref:LysR family transcriptional regulator n=1 Tax=Tomitella fengzijianii TaxID=2597660 RepID=A0A516X5C2_9ACTN|nr:LysR substrate-binding domain-containing protein [Tomitella fengzijianii]QDQ98213.1 LysR family transcriptional regulator [Tomitella fengzijianii]